MHDQTLVKDQAIKFQSPKIEHSRKTLVKDQAIKFQSPKIHLLMLFYMRLK